MKPEDEVNSLKQTLHYARTSNREIDFIKINREIKNDKEYIRVQCSDETAANIIKKEIENEEYSYINFDSIENSDKKYVYVVFVIPSYTQSKFVDSLEKSFYQDDY